MSFTRTCLLRVGRCRQKNCLDDNIGLLSSRGSKSASSVRTNSSTTTIGEDILLRSDDEDHGISILTLNRPKQYNTLTTLLLNELHAQLEQISRDPSVRVVVINSSNPKCFSSGHDLKELLSSSKEGTQELFKKCSTVMMYLTQQLPQPVIAQVDGICTAAGTQLVASCDLAVCSENSKFGVNGIDVGLFCTTPAVALSRSNIPRKHAMSMLLTGDFISSEKALNYGLVNEVVPEKDLEDETMALAKRIAGKSSYAIQLGKQAYYKQLELNSLRGAYEFAGETMCCNMNSHDAQEGIQAFLEKRKPEWKGK